MIIRDSFFIIYRNFCDTISYKTIGLLFLDILFNISTDGEMENISKNVVSKLSHDISVMEIKGENKLFN